MRSGWPSNRKPFGNLSRLAISKYAIFPNISTTRVNLFPYIKTYLLLPIVKCKVHYILRPRQGSKSFFLCSSSASSSTLPYQPHLRALSTALGLVDQHASLPSPNRLMIPNWAIKDDSTIAESPLADQNYGCILSYLIRTICYLHIYTANLLANMDTELSISGHY